MAIGTLEVDAAAAVPIVEFSVVNGPGGTAEGQPSSLHPLQDRVELSVVDVERVMTNSEAPARQIDTAFSWAVQCEPLLTQAPRN